MLTDEQRTNNEKIAAAERRRYRAACKVRCLEANLTRIDPQEFDQLMDQLEAAREEAKAAFYEWSALQNSGVKLHDLREV